MDEILTTARDLELEANEDDIEELIMGHEDELTIEELQEILNDEHQETQRNVSPSEQEEDKREPMPISAIKDLSKKWEAVRATVLEGHPNQADVSRVGDLYNDNAINYFGKILKKSEKQSTLNMFFNAP
ncbi:uncharacterized protein TNCV_195071 [Trichonephila clavipes]|uniref:Uncharacterized protein n=1 Tax=Trichonephila clavipes TaxID=2585209 RepID=A0A8X6WJH3_TRICX|nr:uncharacterized protein TNCV_195071 [Trichonephila clavipes]